MKSLVLTIMSLSFSVFAQDFEMSPNSKKQQTMRLSGPAAFRLINQAGSLAIVESKSSEVEVVLNNRTNQKIKVSLQEIAPGKVKIEATGGNSGGTQIGNIQVGGSSFNNVFVSGGGSVKVSRISGGNVSIINGRVIIDGVEVSPNGDNSGITIGDLEMEVRIPANLLHHLQAEGSSDVALAGEFDSPLSADRIVNLSTRQGQVECIGLCALGNIELESNQGSIEAKQIKGTLTASTKQGSVDASENEGNLVLSTKQGSVTAVNNSGDVKALTKMGSVHIIGQRNGHVIGETNMGSVHFNNPDALSERGSSKMGSVNYTPGKDSCESQATNRPKGKGPFDF